MKPANWANPNYSFDNVFKGMLTLYEAGFPMDMSQDVVERSPHPSRAAMASQSTVTWTIVGAHWSVCMQNLVQTGHLRSELRMLSHSWLGWLDPSSVFRNRCRPLKGGLM